MCNACGFLCCAYDAFEGCGCDHCACPECWSDDEDFDSDDDDYSDCDPGCVTPQDTTPPELKAVLADALAKQLPHPPMENSGETGNARAEPATTGTLPVAGSPINSNLT